MCMELKLFQGVDLILNIGVECDKEVFPQLVEQTTFFPGLQVIFEQSWVVTYKHVHVLLRLYLPCIILSEFLSLLFLFRGIHYHSRCIPCSILF